MADGHALACSENHLKNNVENWDLSEILRYKEANSFTYVDNRIKWTDTFDMLKIFTKNAIFQVGKWLSPGGDYKKFVSNKTDLLITWNYDLGTLTFKGNAEDKLKELLVNMANEDKQTNILTFEPDSMNKDNMSQAGLVVSETGGCHFSGIEG